MLKILIKFAYFTYYSYFCIEIIMNLWQQPKNLIANLTKKVWATILTHAPAQILYVRTV